LRFNFYLSFYFIKLCAIEKKFDYLIKFECIFKSIEKLNEFLSNPEIRFDLNCLSNALEGNYFLVENLKKMVHTDGLGILYRRKWKLNFCDS